MPKTHRYAVKKMQKVHRSAVLEICHKLRGKMPKTRSSAVKKKCQKLAGQRSQNNCQNAKNSQVRGPKKMLTCHSSAVMEKKNSQVRSHKKCQKLAGPRSRKMPKICMSALTKMPKFYRSEVMNKG